MFPAEKAGELMTAWQEHVRLSRAEAGCIRFDYTVSDDGRTVTIDEEWSDKAAFEAHGARSRASAWAAHGADLDRKIEVTGA